MKSFILINFKLFPEALAEKAVALAERIASVRRKKYEIAIAPSLLMVGAVARQVHLPVFSQHADPLRSGAHTGSVSLLELKKIGVRGVILNHSEHKVPLPLLKETIRLCRNYNLQTVVCASSLAEIEKIASFHPLFIAYEPKELIGGKVSVTEAKPEIILKAVELVKRISPKTRILCGAGVHNKEDLGHALLLGTAGVIIGHAAIKAKDPQKFLMEMLI